jgi:phage terminase large subunit
MPNQLEIQVIPKLKPIYSSTHRFIDLYGGRGSGKSWTIADFLLIKGYEKRKRILCGREIQNSIKDSVHKLLSDRIEKYNFHSFYTIKNDSIVGNNGTEFLFKGLLRNPYDIKSMEGIDYAWLEEAHSISRKSLEILIPTIRKDDSQLIFTYNPTNSDDPVHVDYTLSNRPDVLRIECNYNDNMYFPDVLRKEMEWDRSNDTDKYLHIWEGKCLKHSAAQIFNNKWVVYEFESPNIQYDQVNLGADWGFANDPTCLVRCFIKENTLFIDYESGGVGIELDEIPAVFDQIEGSRKFWIKADSSRPETISYIKNKGFNIKPAEKWPGSVEDGIAFLKSFDKIVIHPRCKHTIDEFKLYSYKTDPKTGEILPIIVDKHNHYIDAIRYSQDGMIKKKTNILDRF